MYPRSGASALYGARLVRVPSNADLSAAWAQ